MTAVSNDGYALQYASKELMADKEVVLVAVSNNGNALQFASKELIADKEVILAAVLNDGDALGYVDNKFIADKEVVLTAVSNDGNALMYADDELMADKEVVLAAVSNYGNALKYASDYLILEKDIIIAAVSNGYSLRSVYYRLDCYFSCGESYRLKADKDIVLAAVYKDPSNIQYASNELKADKNLILKILYKHPHVLKYTSKKFYIYLNKSYLTIKYLLYYSSIIYEDRVEGRSILSKLNTHGIYPSKKFKNLIASYLGFNDVIEYTNKPYYSIGVFDHSDGEFWDLVKGIY